MADPELAPVLATTLDAPWGPVRVAATDAGIVAIELLTTPDAFEAGLVRRLRRPVAWSAGPTSNGTPASLAGSHIDAVRLVFRARLAGSGPGAGTPDGGATSEAAELAIPIDLSDRPAWDRAVLAAVRSIPRGETRSYADIARAVDRPGAARAVGGAVGRNPVGFLVPCHRVIAADGTLGGYGGGWWGDRERLLALKEDLLAREGIMRPRRLPAPRRGR